MVNKVERYLMPVGEYKKKIKSARIWHSSAKGYKMVRVSFVDTWVPDALLMTKNQLPNMPEFDPYGHLWRRIIGAPGWAEPPEDPTWLIGLEVTIRIRNMVYGEDENGDPQKWAVADIKPPSLFEQ